MAGAAAVPNCGVEETAGVENAVVPVVDPNPPNDGVDAACPKRPVLGAVAAVPKSPVAGAALPNTEAVVVVVGNDEPNEKVDGAALLVVAAPKPKAGAACVWVVSPPPKMDEAVVVAAGCCCPKAEEEPKVNPCPGLLFPPNMLLAVDSLTARQLDPDSCRRVLHALLVPAPAASFPLLHKHGQVGKAGEGCKVCSIR